MDRFQPFDSLPNSTEFHSRDDDVLQFLEFSDPDYGQPLALPAPPNDEATMELPDMIQDASFWDFDVQQPVNKQFVLADHGVGNFEAIPPVNHEIPATSTPHPQVPPSTIDCSGCQVLREVVHSNGSQNLKLSVHGGPGTFYHAILDVYHNIHGFPPAAEQSYIDLRTRSFDWVKNFLINYGLLRVHDNYVILQDTLSVFYDALCANMRYVAASTDTVNVSTSPESGLCQSRPVEVDCSHPVRTLKTGIAAQRERTGSMQLRDLIDYFHLPIADAAKELGICTTALKKICRKHGMPRWPHRKK
ncbi:uncharacterized protein [Elaeis guineensis]|uniref:uncharacterized protein isoform X2 n=1 Tax=Elaeis guineensis var. tenera TaxID=51953 RepID=UPI003C6D6F00